MNKAAKTSLFALVAVVAACSDAVSPKVATPDSPMVYTGGVTTDLSTTDTVRFSITLDPSHATTYFLGAGNSLYFPTGSVCDPALSTYGSTEWDKPCTPLSATMTENVKAWLDAKGHPRVDFTPNIRFVPSVLPSNWVVITFADYTAALDPWFNILYCASATSGCINETLTDPALVTLRDPVTGKVTRRIKHFSGYLVGAGDDSTGSDGTFNRAPVKSSLPVEVAPQSKGRSGYILVSGRQ